MVVTVLLYSPMIDKQEITRIASQTHNAQSHLARRILGGSDKVTCSEKYWADAGGAVT
jgi:hypothetical protein